MIFGVIIAHHTRRTLIAAWFATTIGEKAPVELGGVVHAVDGGAHLRAECTLQTPCKLEKLKKAREPGSALESVTRGYIAMIMSSKDWLEAVHQSGCL